MIRIHCHGEGSRHKNRGTLKGVLPALVLGFAFSFTNLVFPAGIEKVTHLVEQDQFTKALVEINHLLEATPDDPELLFLKATILQKTGSDGAAVEILRKLTETYPQMPEPFNNLAIYYAEQGEYDQAISISGKGFPGKQQLRHCL